LLIEELKYRLATVCNKSGANNCYHCYMTLGQYNRFIYNPNGFHHCPNENSKSKLLYIYIKDFLVFLVFLVFKVFFWFLKFFLVFSRNFENLLS
jgi:hypothetical protein